MFIVPFAACAQSHISQSSSNSLKAISASASQIPASSKHLSSSNFNQSLKSLEFILGTLKELTLNTAGLPRNAAKDLETLYGIVKSISPQMSVEGTSAIANTTSQLTGRALPGSIENPLVEMKQEILNAFQSVFNLTGNVTRSLSATLDSVDEINANDEYDNDEQSSGRSEHFLSGSVTRSLSITNRQSQYIVSESSDGTTDAANGIYVNPLLDGTGLSESSNASAMSSVNLTGETIVSVQDLGMVTSEEYRKIQLDAALLNLLNEIDLKSDQSLNSLMTDPIIIDKALSVQESYGEQVPPGFIVLAATLSLN